MNEILLGFVGALVLVVLLAVGTCAGWFLHKAVVTRTTRVAEPPGEAERKRLIAEQKAFHQMQNFSAEQAYGMNSGNLFDQGGDG